MITGTPPVVGATAQFTAMATLSDGTTLDVTSVSTWVSSNTAEAVVSASGLVTGVSAGTVTVQATYHQDLLVPPHLLLVGHATTPPASTLPTRLESSRSSSSAGVA